MDYNEKSLTLISSLKISKKAVSDILEISYSSVNDKFRLIKSNRFTEKDYNKLTSFLNKIKSNV